MKAENVIGIVGLVALVGFMAFTLQRYETLVRQPVVTNPTTTTNTSTTNTTASNAISIADVATHATSTDCWIIVRAKVYNVTNYLTQHPGGAFRIIPYCGADATTAFATRGGSGTHSNVAENELSTLYLGDAQTSSTVLPTNVNTNVNSALNTNAATNTNVPPSSTSAVPLTTQAVALHRTPSDCWIIVNNGVYAVTSYLNKHPGGASRITPYCGANATSAFATRGGTGSHSNAASADLAALRLGTLGSSTTTSTIQKVNTNASTITSSGEDAREEKDDD